MLRSPAPLICGALCFSLILCTSCVTITAPGSPNVKQNPNRPDGERHTEARADGKIVDTWELIYQINEQGDQELPRESTRTLIEFTDHGRVIMNRINKDTSDPVRSGIGKYVVHDDELSITDDGGRSVRWPYKITGDTLILSMPQAGKKFFLRRYK